MTPMHKTLACVSAIALFAVGAQAQTIDFGGLPGANGQAFTGPYVEDGFSTSATGGQVFEGHVFGNPQPSLVVGSVFNGGNLGVIETSRAATFRLVQFDLSAQNGAANYTVEGFRGAALIYSFGGAAGPPFATFQTFGGNAGVIDRVRFTLAPGGTSVNLDNIVLRDAAVPEPGVWALLIAGFGMAGYSIRSRKVRYALA